MISEDYHCVSVSYLFGSPLSQSIFVYEWPHLSVALTLPVRLYTEDKHQQQNKADIMMLGLMGRRGRVPDSWVVFRPVIGWLRGQSTVLKGFRQDGVRWGGQDEQRGFPLQRGRFFLPPPN